MDTQFSNTLIHWYKANARALPWRETRDPYRIWLSEIILQQTRVEQGLPYYQRFIENFPAVKDLADANEEKVMKCWQGLGYYSRARNLHATAKFISASLNGVFPNTYSSILKLKGIGPYTAAAIASFAFDEAVPVVDGNVYRFISRYAGVEMEIGSSKAHHYFSELLKELMPEDQAATFNQALMEFGALQCVPKSPQCHLCPFQSSCYAFAKKKIDVLPVKLKKTKVLPVFYHFASIRHHEKTWLTQRNDSGLWKKLWHFPMLEFQEDIPEQEALHLLLQDLGLNQNQVKLKGQWKTIHLLSHRRIQAVFWEIDSSVPPDKNDIFEIDAWTLEEYALPTLMSKYLKAKEDVSK